MAKKSKVSRYIELVQCVPLRPIRTDDELDEAINMVDYLIDRKKLGIDERDYLDVLSDLIQQYEAKHVVFERQPPDAMLRFLIEGKGVAQAQVAKDCRIAESTISALLAGERKMNRNHIAKFAAYFNVGPGVFFGD